MTYTAEEMARTLRAARLAKGLSQRELSGMAGVPQGHISRIESGAIDLRLSSLIGLARALDLEPMLVPRRTIPAVLSIIRPGGAASGAAHAGPEPARPAYSLDEDDLA
jgi:DNA-binding XRE family transcriptional regulator